ncbi:MAG TPA: Uma2 family endonuclease [Polyangiaceae bacterium]|nr:Uma2 family endonuclease [Polyangiaceae bacterium]
MARAVKQLDTAHDPTVYPSDDHMGEGSLQRFISELVRLQLEAYLNGLGRLAFVGANQFVYWRQFDPSRKLAPDVFVLPGVRPGIKVDSWKVWESGIAPSFALEIVSQDWEKDYRDAPAPYDELGVRELIIFDPEWASRPNERLRWQVYRRLARRGFVRVETGNGDRARSKALGCWLRAVGDDLDALRLRLATDPRGDELIPTADEALARAEQALRAESEAHARAEQALRTEREALQAEREARARAEAELTRLRAELGRRPRSKR